MTTSALVLILAVLLLGGIIAALGDRLGTKVGKARLRLFNLRPRQTAIVVTVITGTLIAGSTLAILLALSKNLRQGIFLIDDIRKQRRQAEAELSRVSDAKAQVEEQLSIAKSEQTAIKDRLISLNQNYQDAQIQLQIVSQQATVLEQEVQSLRVEREQLSQLREQLKNQVEEFKAQITTQNEVIAAKQAEIQNLQQQQESLQIAILTRDQKILELDGAIANKNLELAEQKTQLQDLEDQIRFLNREVAILEEYYRNYQELRAQTITIAKGQILAFNLVRVVEPEAVNQAINHLLREANQSALKAFNIEDRDTNQRLVQITQAQVEQLALQLSDGQEYVIRILSAGNYIAGEQEVRVFADVAVNQIVFNPEDELASVSIDADTTEEEQIQARIDWLLAASEFRARRAGVLGDIQIGDGRLITLVNFLQEVSEADQPPDEIKAIVSETSYTSGPLKLRLIALVNGKIRVST
ncbi:DUF3084 domain-containing protein [Gloeocapsa sp. PCC 73106]|uniref:DUF3084 domain-containing protein n=1 Tax=Gloeocapsa sp. PCC 73106 TaxID=102232 RepID=UPI0002AC5D0A|nr:DUF3084 domain-containing protein [Gloeocapsa sp. PCC 73106]ELR99581.1 hypothetical protein GLO73106DRAFT_00034330 [Gloeocapsa sp. PCC 73106]